MNAPANGWIIGVDFDNTIAGYNDLMHTVALERSLISADVARNKKLIRDAIRALPDGEAHWRDLQVTVYGPRMHEARLIKGVREFFADCRRRRITVYIISHKTEYANFGEANVNLRTVAMTWLEQHGFFHAGITSTIADSAGGYAAYTLFPADSSVLTVEFKINLIAPAQGEKLIATGRVKKSGRTLTICEFEVVVIQGCQGKTCALGLQTLMCLQGRKDMPQSG